MFIPDDLDYDAPTALYFSAVEKMVLEYMEKIPAIDIEKAMERKAISTLEKIRCILNDDTLNDTDCFYKIDELIMLFFRELEVRTNRHWELD